MGGFKGYVGHEVESRVATPRMKERLQIPRTGKSEFSHLPPGHEPGAQSLRNRTGWPFWAWFTGIVGTGMVIGGLFVAAGGRGSAFNPWEEAIGGTIFAFFGAVCAVWAYSLGQRSRPSRLRMAGVDLAVDHDEARRGEELTATFTHAQGAKDVELGLVCLERWDYQARSRTKYGSMVIRQTGEAHAYEHWQRVDSAAGEQTVTFRIPADAPQSYEGECVSYAWRVSARAVRRLRPDPRIDHPVWVLP